MERTYLRIIQGSSRGLCATLFKSLLLPLSWIYRFIVFTRNKAYDFGVLSIYTPNVPAVISVGNIAVGGTGKTPVTMLLTKNLLDKVPVAILSRGYRSHAEDLKTPLRLSNGNGPEYPVSLCGDEPFLLAENLSKAKIFVGKDRKQAAEMAANQGVKLVILDDGMQHRQLARNFDVVVLDANNPFGHEYLLPRGLLREEISSLRRADLVILNNTHNKAQYTSISEQISKYTDAPVVGTAVQVMNFHTLEGEQIETLKDKKVGMFCGIGNPDGFAQTLTSQGATVVDKYILSDHRKVDAKILANFADQCKALGAECLVCTEKDKVKLQIETLDLSIPVVWIKIELEINEGLEHWKKFIKKTLIQARAKASD